MQAAMRTIHSLTAAVALSVILPATASAAAWPTVARSMAGTVAARWAADLPADARLGAEPPGRCRLVGPGHAACPIGIALLARDATSRRPWRCAATVLVSRTGDRVATRRTGTRCTRFPSATAVPDAAAAFGTAFALDATGDIACLPAGNGRTTCVVRYVAGAADRCIRAASVPLGAPARSLALGAPICRRR
jgi:hypothetical protein